MAIIRFGVDGWDANEEHGEFDEASLRRLVEAVATIWAEDAPGATVYVGYDARAGACEHARIAAGVLAAFGLSAKLSDSMCPTPALGWTVAQDESAVGGVMITANKLPGAFQGVRIRMEDGCSAPRHFTEMVEAELPPSPSIALAEYEEVDLLTPYLASLAAFVDSEAIRAAGLHVVVDPVYGASTGVLAGLMRTMGVAVDEIHAADGTGSLHGMAPDVVEPWVDGCCQAVRFSGADAGFVIDGDGDRCGAVANGGEFLSAHRIVPLVMRLLARERACEGRFVMTISASALPRVYAEHLGRSMTITPTGFSGLHGEMVRGGVLMASEEYGGISVPAHFMERDGLLVALLLLELLATTGRSMAELLADLEQDVGTLHYMRRDLRIDAGDIQALRNLLPGINPPEVAGTAPVLVSHADGLYLRFADDSWILLRPSRTDPLVRVYAEARTKDRGVALMEAACAFVRASDVHVVQ